MDRELAVALDVSVAACEIMQRHFSEGVSPAIKSDGSPVTAADLEINELARSQLTSAFPDYGFLGEEGSDMPASHPDYVWVCDPIDGTRPFALGVPLSTFSLALTFHGDPMLGVVAYPFRDWTFVGQKGKGATLNSERIHVSSHPLRRGIVDVLTASRLEHWVPGLEDEIDQAGGVPISYGSCALTAALVATGELVGSVLAAATPWDGAATKVIVEEAGGRFTDLDGNDQRYDAPVNGYVASNGIAHQEILDLIAKCGVRPGQIGEWQAT